MKKTTASPKGNGSLRKEKQLKEERAEIVEKDLIAGAESIVDETRTRSRLNAKISHRIEIQR